MIENIMSFLRELKVGVRSLARSKGLTATVALTLALGIGANAAMFSLVRAVLLRPLVNRDENRLIYIRQSAPAAGAENETFSIPEVVGLALARENAELLRRFLRDWLHSGRARRTPLG